jgi:hypothetical protein
MKKKQFPAYFSYAISVLDRENHVSICRVNTSPPEVTIDAEVLVTKDQLAGLIDQLNKIKEESE